MCARYAISVCSLAGQCSSRSKAVARANRSVPQELDRSLLDARGESRLATCQPRADKEITNKSNASATNFLRSRVLRSEQVAGDFTFCAFTIILHVLSLNNNCSNNYTDLHVI